MLGQDVLLEPFGAEAFGMTVTQTTRITSIWGTFVLIAHLIAGGLEGRVQNVPWRKLAIWLPWQGFVVIVFSGFIRSLTNFYFGVILLGIGTGLSTVANLSLMFDLTVAGSVGLYIGAWGFSNALSRLAGSLLGGIVRDVVTQATGQATERVSRRLCDRSGHAGCRCGDVGTYRCVIFQETSRRTSLRGKSCLWRRSENDERMAFPECGG